MPNETPVLRRATPADAALLAELGARTFRDAFAADNRPEDMALYLRQAFSTDQIEAELREPGSVFLLAGTGNGAPPLGYARLVAGPAPPCVHGPRPVELSRIYVEQSVVGGGYGAALMRASLEEASRGGFATIWLGVWERNLRAVRFYERWGFVTVGEHEFVLGTDVQSDLVMERSLELGPSERAAAATPEVRE